jgi:hypothetical protein
VGYWIIRKQRQKRKRQPRPCKICGALTDDDYRLSAPAEIGIICPLCVLESEILSYMQDWGWITPDGKIRPAFRRARKRHFLKEKRP